MNRRGFLSAGASFGAGLALGIGRAGAADTSTFNIGFQKNGVLVVARNQRLIEQALEPQGYRVNWVEFPSGPPLLEAMNAGSVDFGATGDTPVIFAQAAKSNVVYAAALPSRGRNSAILVPKTSAIQTLKDLKGKRLAFTKGSSAHNVAVAALDKAGLSYTDIEPLYLSPADATAAFVQGSLDAWSIWDPFFAAAQQNYGARLLADGEAILGKTNSFFLANGNFAKTKPDILRTAIAALKKAGEWADGHKDGVAEAMAAATGVPVSVQKVTEERGEFTITAVTPDIVATQQAVADRFADLKLIPRKISVAERIWAEA